MIGRQAHRDNRDNATNRGSGREDRNRMLKRKTLQDLATNCKLRVRGGE